MRTVWGTKTFWVNVLYALLAILVSPDVTALIPEWGMKYVIAGQAVINIILRRITDRPVTFGMDRVGVPGTDGGRAALGSIVTIAFGAFLLSMLLFGCALKYKSAVVNLAAASEQALGAFQDGERALCNPAIKWPNPITACTDGAHALGLTDTRHHDITAGEAKAFEFMRSKLVPALRAWRAGDPAPKEFGEFLQIVRDVFDLARQVSRTTATAAFFSSIDVVLNALGELAKTIGAVPAPEWMTSWPQTASR